MKQFKYYLMAAFVAAATCTGFSSCSDNDDEESTVNPAVDVVNQNQATRHQPFCSVLLAVPIMSPFLFMMM